MSLKKSSNKNCGILLAVLMLGFIFCICVYPAHSSSQDPIKLKLACWLPEPSIEGKMGKWWGNEIEKRSNGRVKVSYYYAQALVKTMDSLPAVSKGISDVQFVGDNYYPTNLALVEGTHLLYQTSSCYVMGKGYMEMCRTYPPVQKMLKDNNVKYIMCTPAQETIIASVKPIRTLEDVKGMKIRAMGHMNESIRLLGATPVAMPSTSVYEALERGTIDAITSIPYSLNVAFKFHEVAKYMVNPYLGCYTTGGYYMNLDTLNKLPVEIQKIINDLVGEYLDAYLEMVNEASNKTTKAMLAANCDIYSLTPAEADRWKAKIVPQIYNDWIEKVEKKGLPGREFLELYHKLIKKYTPMDKYHSPFKKQ